MKVENYQDASLVLVGHGSSVNDDSATALRQQAAELRRRGHFRELLEGFWKQEPTIPAAIASVTSDLVFVLPFFISEGYFSEEAVPETLGFRTVLETFGGNDPSPGLPATLSPSDGERDGVRGGSHSEIANILSDKRSKTKGEASFSRILQRGTQALIYCKPVGTHEGMTQVLLSRARSVVRDHPFPRLPDEHDLTLFIAGHGTPRNTESRKSIDRQVELIRQLGVYTDVHPVFMEEEPRIADWHTLSATRSNVMVPFFLSDGMHVREDIPVLLGEPESRVRERLAAGQPTWRNPTEKHGKRLWYSDAVGTDMVLIDVILERVREAAAWTGEGAIAPQLGD